MESKERDKYIFTRIKEHYDDIKDKYEIVGIFLQGSQNYGLDIYDEDYMSDIDTKAIVLPTFDEFVKNCSPVSTTYVRENNEHIDIKDIRLMFENIAKQNINFVEIIFTKFKIINPKYKELFSKILENNELISRLSTERTIRSIAGMSSEKLKALCHPYPSLLDKIEKFGYDPKQLHHIARLNIFIKDYIEGKLYRDCLLTNDKNLKYLIDLKKGILSLEDAKELANRLDSETHQIYTENKLGNDNINPQALELLKSVSSDIIRQRFTDELVDKIEDKEEFEPKNIYVTSDLHFYHDNILTFENRPFKDVEHMNQEMIKIWNKTVSDDDLVYILGDFSFGNGYQTNEILKSLNGRKILIVGNHDYFLDDKKFDRSLFEDIQDCLKTQIYGRNFFMCHYPLSSCTRKMISLYGHVHSNEIGGLHSTDKIELRSYNVGVDVNNFKPINIKKIIKLFP